jgi:hypothetical protein
VDLGLVWQGNFTRHSLPTSDLKIYSFRTQEAEKSIAPEIDL